MTTSTAATGTGKGHHRAGRARAVPVWFDRLVGSDPGLNRLRTAGQAVVTIGLAMLAELVFVRTTHALQISAPAGLPPEQAALVAFQHHAVQVIAIMLGAIIGLVSAFAGGLFATNRQEVQASLLMTPLMVAGLAVGLLLGDYRLPSLVALVVVLSLGAYGRKFGPLGFIGGQMLFMGDFFGFFLHAQFSVGDLGALTAEIGIGSVVAIGARFAFFHPGRKSALRRMRRSYQSRARGVAAAAVEVLDAPASAASTRRLQRRLVRLNETALLIDAQISDPASMPSHWSGAVLHQCLFDAELALANTARLAGRISTLELAPGIRAQVRGALAAIGQGDQIQAELAARQLLDLLDAAGLTERTHVVVHRFAISVLGYAGAVTAWRAATPETGGASVAEPFVSTVVLAGAYLPGSTFVSATASQEAVRSHRFWDRVALAPNVRVAIQMGVAVTLAVALGDALDGKRFYWAVIATFVTFMGANNTVEQVRKGMLRVAGTVVGAIVGATLAHLVGQDTNVAIVVILVALFFGLYLMRISYAFMVVGITVMVSQLYVQLDEFSNSLLLLRLEETALGAGVAAVTVLCVLPLRTGRVARVAAREFLNALDVTVERAVQSLAEPGTDTGIRVAARDLDLAHQSLAKTVAALRTPVVHDSGSPRERFLAAADACRNYARNLVVDTASSCAPLDDEAREQLLKAGQVFSSSLAQLVAGLQDAPAARRDRLYRRSASLFDRVATLTGCTFTAPEQLALRDLQLVDGALASAAESLGLRVASFDAELVQAG